MGDPSYSIGSSLTSDVDLVSPGALLSALARSPSILKHPTHASSPLSLFSPAPRLSRPRSTPPTCALRSDDPCCPPLLHRTMSTEPRRDPEEIVREIAPLVLAVSQPISHAQRILLDRYEVMMLGFEDSLRPADKEYRLEILVRFTFSYQGRPHPTDPARALDRKRSLSTMSTRSARS